MVKPVAFSTLGKVFLAHPGGVARSAKHSPCPTVTITATRAHGGATIQMPFASRLPSTAAPEELSPSWPCAPVVLGADWGGGSCTCAIPYTK